MSNISSNDLGKFEIELIESPYIGGIGDSCSIISRKNVEKEEVSEMI